MTRWLAGPTIVIALLLAGAAAEGGEARRPLQPVPSVVHVHSTLTSGDRSLDELARMARAEGVAALLLAENYLLRVEYGLAPFRALTRVVYDEPSVLTGGPERYLAAVAEARRRYPEVLMLPGVEVIPHHYWTGSPLAMSMTLHNTQKNVLVWGVTDPAALRSLPASGNPHGRRYGWESLVEAVPALLIVPGALLLLIPRVRRVRVGRAITVQRHRHWFWGGLLVLVGAVALVRGWPFTVDAYPPWRDFRVDPHQDLIDHVDALGGATVWSLPEAFDEGRRSVLGVQVAWRTDPYPDDLMKTFRYTAFGAIYAQPTRFEQPGGRWDRLLVEYARGERSRPAWALGESGFHGHSSNRRLSAIQTVFLTTEPTEAGILDALKRGRLYALQRLPEGALVLGDWSVTAGGATAISGETLRVPAGTVLDLRVAVDATGETADGFRVTLVRDGVVTEGWSGAQNVRATYRETFDGRPLVFRVDARGRAPHRIVTSPIFVTSEMGGLERAPQTPPPSSRPGEAGARLESR